MTSGALDTLAELLEDFKTELRQQNKSPGTIDTYSRDVGYFIKFLEDRDIPATADEFTRAAVGGYIENVLSRPNIRTGKPVTPEYAHRQYRSLQQFAKYLVAEEILVADPFAKLKPPTVPEKPVPVPPIEDLQALLKVCEGNDFESRRDTAIIRFLTDVGPRIGEVAPLNIDDLDFNDNTAQVA